MSSSLFAREGDLRHHPLRGIVRLFVDWICLRLPNPCLSEAAASACRGQERNELTGRVTGMRLKCQSDDVRKCLKNRYLPGIEQNFVVESTVNNLPSEEIFT